MAINAYQVPGILINQQFETTPVSTTPILSALIVGPNYSLFRNSVADEKALCAVVNPNNAALGNTYQSGSDVTYSYPNQPLGSVVDTNYVQLDLDNVYAQYLPNTGLGSNSGNAAAALVTAASGSPYPNRLRFTNGSTTVLQTLNSFNRSSYLSNRDVRVGDIATITDNLNNVLVTPITGLVADTYLQDSALESVIAPVLASETDGVTNGTSTFSSAGATFTSALQGNFLTIATEGTFKILSVASPTSLTIAGTPGASTGLTYYVGGTYNDPGNVAPVTGTHGSVTYAWEGIGSNPGTTGITVVASTSFAYVGYNNQRVLSDTYSILCTTPGGDSVAAFTVSSANNVFIPFTATMNGSGIVAMDTNGSNNVRLTFTFSAASVAVGQSWSIPVSATVTEVEPTASGTFTGAGNVTYKLAVTRGGPLYTGSNSATCAIITITSSNVDSSPSVFPASAVAFQVGTLGVMASLTASNNGGLILGDAYYIPAIAAVAGAVKTLQFANNLSASSLNNASTWTVTLSEIQQGYNVNPIASVEDNTLNWVATESGITVNRGITTDDVLLVSGGVPVALPVTTANIFVTYRALNTTNNNVINSLTDPSQIPAVLGIVDPDNNVAQGVSKALLNSAGATVYYITVASDDEAGYTTALGIADGSTSGYGLVPLTFNTAAQEAFAADVDAQSQGTVAHWRSTWLCIPAVPTALLYDKQSNGSNWLATVSSDPESASTVYSLVEVDGANFITAGVRPGDIVLINFVSLPNGVISYTSINVASVRSQNTLALVTGLTGPISVGTKFQLQRNYASSEQATNLAAKIGGFDDRRVKVVFPNTAGSSGTTLEGYYLAAAAAGAASGVPANQGLTNQTILGFDDVSETFKTFNVNDLNTLASEGAFIITQSVLGAPPYVRDELTTGEASGNLNFAKDSITRNVDSISYQLSSILRPYIGKYNITNITLRLIKDAINGLLNELQSVNTNSTAGPQLLPGSQVLSISQDPTFLDRVNVSVALVIPYALDVLIVNLAVGQNGVTVASA